MHPALLAATVLLWATPCAALQPPPDLGALAGETLEFRVRWGVIPAARANLQVVDAGDGKLGLLATARTLPYIDVLYPVRERVESTVLVAGPRSLRYYHESSEGRRRNRKAEVVFDPAHGVARYRQGESAPKSLLVPEGIQDPLSCFYAYRTMDLSHDEVAHLDITDGKRLVTGVVTVLGRETVETPAGTFRTVVIEPKIDGIRGIFRKSPGARILIWLTDDRWRRPVKLRSKVVVGHFTAELTRIRHPAAAPRGP